MNIEVKTANQVVAEVDQTLQGVKGEVQTLFNMANFGEEAITKANEIYALIQQHLTSVMNDLTSVIDTKHLQAMEVFQELERAGENGVDMYSLHTKYKHSPALMSWFTRKFELMLEVKDDRIYLRKA